MTAHYQVIQNSEKSRIEAISAEGGEKHHEYHANGIASQIWGSQSLLYITLFLTRIGYTPTSMNLTNGDWSAVDLAVEEEIANLFIARIAADDPEGMNNILVKEARNHFVHAVTFTKDNDVVIVNRDGQVTVEAMDPIMHVVNVLTQAKPESRV